MRINTTIASSICIIILCTPAAGETINLSCLVSGQRDFVSGDALTVLQNGSRSQPKIKTNVELKNISVAVTVILGKVDIARHNPFRKGTETDAYIEVNSDRMFRHDSASSLDLIFMNGRPAENRSHNGEAARSDVYLAQDLELNDFFFKGSFHYRSKTKYHTFNRIEEDSKHINLIIDRFTGDISISDFHRFVGEITHSDGSSNSDILTEDVNIKGSCDKSNIKQRKF